MERGRWVGVFEHHRAEGFLPEAAEARIGAICPRWLRAMASSSSGRREGHEALVVNGRCYLWAARKGGFAASAAAVARGS
jgi:predicted transcriptional regulator